MPGSKKSTDSVSDSEKSAKNPVTARKEAAKKASESKAAKMKLSSSGSSEGSPVETVQTEKTQDTSKPKASKKIITPSKISVSDAESGAVDDKSKKIASPKSLKAGSKTMPMSDTPEKNFYTDDELMEFKQIIDEKLAAAKEELRLINDEVIRISEMGGEDRHFNPEEVSGSIEKEHLSQIALRQVQYIQHLENALIRIKNKSYGICRVTGKLIAKDRLRAVPHATLSMEAKLSQK